MMEAQIREKLDKAGIDVAGALERLNGKEELFTRLLNKFLNDTNFEKLKTAIDSGNYEEAANAAHALKGVCGNLAMTELFQLSKVQLETFRAGDSNKAVEFMPEITVCYNRIVDAIRSM